MCVWTPHVFSCTFPECWRDHRPGVIDYCGQAVCSFMRYTLSRIGLNPSFARQYPSNFAISRSKCALRAGLFPFNENHPIRNWSGYLGADCLLCLTRTACNSEQLYELALPRREEPAQLHFSHPLLYGQGKKLLATKCKPQGNGVRRYRT